MDEKDRWSVHVEYLKLAIALASALIAAGAAIYVDVSKIPVDKSRYVLLAGVGAFFVTLIFSVWSIGLLATHVKDAPATATAVAGGKQAQNAVLLANLSFFSLVIGAGLLGAFFMIRTIDPRGMSFEQAIATADVANRKLIDAAKGESVTLKSIELLGDSYRLVFQINPTAGSTTVLTDALGTNLKSATRQ